MNKKDRKVKFHSYGSVLTVLVCVFLVIMFVQRTHRYVELQQNKWVEHISQESGSDLTEELGKDSRIVQTIVNDGQPFSGISVKFSKTDDCEGTVHVRILDDKTDKTLQSWELDIASVTNNEYTNFTSQDREQYKDIRMEVDADVSAGVIKMWENAEDAYEAGELQYVSGESVTQETGDLIFKTVSLENQDFLFTYYRIGAVVFVLFAIVAGYLFVVRKNTKIEHMFALAVAVLGIFYIFLLPPFSAPDEPMHFATSYKYSSDLLGKESLDADGKICMRDADAEFFSDLDLYPNADSYKNTAKNLLKSDKSSTTQSVTEKVVPVSIISYIPQIIGITIARLFGMGTMGLVYMGRLFNLLVFAVLTYCGIKKMPFGKMILFGVAMLPMSLELAGSYSYDALINGLAFFFIGYVMSLIYQAEKIRKRDAAVLAITMFFLAPLKMVYMFLGLLCLLIPQEKYEKRRYFWGCAAMVMLVAFVSMLIANLGNLQGVAQAGSEGSGIIEWAQEPGYTLGYMLKHPLSLILMYMDTFVEKMDFYFVSMLGGMLGWLEINVPTYLVVGFSVILLLASVPVAGEVRTFKWWHRVFFVGIFAAAFGLVLLSMLTGWTPSSYRVIEGVQGRYFLPVLPMLLLLIRCKNIEFKKNINGYLAYGICILEILTMIYTFRIIITR